MDATLEQRVGNLEREIEELKAALPHLAEPSGAGDWRSTFGWARDCPIYDQAMDAGESYRASRVRESEGE